MKIEGFDNNLVRPISPVSEAEKIERRKKKPEEESEKKKKEKREGGYIGSNIDIEV